MRIQVLFLLSVLAAGSASAQIRTFKWNDGVCEFAGIYNAKKYRLDQVRNTYRLLSHDGFRLDTVGATVWNYDEIAKIDVPAVDAQYKEIVDKLEHLEYISTPYTDSIRNAKLKEARQYYQLVRTTMVAYTDPKVIRNYEGAEACKLNFGEPIIAGGEKLVNAWRGVNLDSQTRNADPARLKRRWDEQNASPDRLKFALVETMSFGWWNCANALIERALDGQKDRPDREFKKLFIRVRTLRCDEP